MYESAFKPTEGKIGLAIILTPLQSYFLLFPFLAHISPMWWLLVALRFEDIFGIYLTPALYIFTFLLTYVVICFILWIIRGRRPRANKEITKGKGSKALRFIRYILYILAIVYMVIQSINSVRFEHSVLLQGGPIRTITNTAVGE